MRELSPEAVSELLAQQTEGVYLHIIKISHPSLANNFYYVDNTEPLVRSDATYQPAAFKTILPSEDDQTPKIQLQIDNVDQSIIQVLRPLQSAPTLSISVVRASNPDTIEIGPYNVSLKQFHYDKFTITGTLGYDEDFLNEQFPKDTFTPQNTPGIF